MNQQRTITEVERSPWPLPIFNVISKATIYRPRFGNRSRSFTTMAAAIEYEDGFSAYPQALPDVATQSPAGMGWLDADRAQQARDDARADAAFDGAQS